MNIQTLDKERYKRAIENTGEEVVRFLYESNLIEDEESTEALEDSVVAWHYVKKHREKIGLHSILESHARLMRRLNPEIAGIIRDVPIEVVGGKYSCLEPEKIRKYLDLWLADDYRDEARIDKLHTLFLIIHPFEDGNGRIARILMNAQRLNIGLPIKVIKASKKEVYLAKYLS